MSVVNDMLRELDKRKHAPARDASPLGGVARGTLVVGAPPERLGRRMLLPAAMLLVTAGGAGLFVWRQHSGVPAASLPLYSTAVQPQPANSMKLSAFVSAAANAAEAHTPATYGKAQPIALKIDTRFAWAPSVPTPTNPPRAVIRAEIPLAAVQSPAAKAPISAKSNSPAGAEPLVETASEQPSLQALAQAQSLFDAGQQSGAVDLLAPALASAAESAGASPSAAEQSALISMATELTRMQSVRGAEVAALAQLTRLEPALAFSAQVWSLRGNLAQRLGRHRESVAAYQRALLIRPNEPRWMLGTAVSLAADGHPIEAAEWAERAAAGGVTNKELTTYLQSMGVVFPAR